MTVTNNEIKSIKALASKKGRDEAGLFVVEGEKMVAEALASGFHVEKVYRRSEVGDAVMDRLSSLSSPSPVLAVVRQKEQPAPSRIENGLYLMLDTIRDPGNLGTIIRIADWFGIKAVIATPDTVEMYNPKVVQSTMGAIFRVPVIYTDVIAFAESVVSAGGNVYGTFLDGENMYSKTLASSNAAPCAIVIGNESNGISDEMAQHVTDRLFIPPFPHDAQTSDSLNAAVATAITVAEFRRQESK